MRRTRALVLGGAVALCGCGATTPAAQPAAVIGTYKVQVAAYGASDPDVMSVIAGSGSDVLLEFVTGISEVRCQLAGATDLTLPRQRLTVAHSTGSADGQATGGGTIKDGAVDLTIHLATLGIGADGGDGAPVDYRVTGAKQ